MNVTEKINGIPVIAVTESQAPPTPISGLRLTIPKGRVAEEKKNHLEFAASSKG